MVIKKVERTRRNVLTEGGVGFEHEISQTHTSRNGWYDHHSAMDRLGLPYAVFRLA